MIDADAIATMRSRIAELEAMVEQYQKLDTILRPAPAVYVATLDEAIRRELSPDPHIGEPHPDTVAAVAEFVRLMCEVSKRRPKAYANEPWLGIGAEEHFEHAYNHAGEAYEEDVATGEDEIGIDDDGLPHAAHAGLRLAFGVARVAQSSSSSSSSEGPAQP